MCPQHVAAGGVGCLLGFSTYVGITSAGAACIIVRAVGTRTAALAVVAGISTPSLSIVQVARIAPTQEEHLPFAQFLPGEGIEQWAL